MKEVKDLTQDLETMQRREIAAINAHKMTIAKIHEAASAATYSDLEHEVLTLSSRVGIPELN